MLFIIAFAFGFLAACSAALLEMALLGSNTTSFSTQGLATLLGVAIIEELAKYLFLWQYGRRFFQTVATSIRHTAMVGLSFGGGFAGLEILFILWNDSIGPLGFLFGIITLHIVTTLLLSAFLFSTRRTDSKRALLIMCAAIAIHTLYNTALFLLF